jgi:putative sterol carrier protein
MERGVSQSEDWKQATASWSGTTTLSRSRNERWRTPGLRIAELEKENEAKSQQSEALDKEIERKLQKANRENGNAILSGSGQPCR